MEQKTLIKIVLFLCMLLLCLLLFNCSEETVIPRNAKQNVSFTVTAVDGKCVEQGLYAIALVDLDDKFSQEFYFGCATATGSAWLDHGDKLEIRVFKNGFEFNRKTLYTITVAQNDSVTTFESVDFVGIKYLVK